MRAATAPVLSFLLLSAVLSCEQNDRDRAESPASAKEPDVTRAPKQASLPARTAILLIVIPEKLDALEAREKYGDAIDRLLAGEKLGELGSGIKSGESEGATISIDVRVNNLSVAVPKLRQLLRSLDCPQASRIEELVEGNEEPLQIPVWTQ